MCHFVVKLTPPDFAARPVRSLAEFKAAFKLIYREYVSLGYCDRNDSRMHYTAHSLLPSSRTFILKKGRILLGTISLIPDSPCGFPMETTFPKLIQEFRLRNRKIAEVSLLTLHQKAFHSKEFGLTDIHRLTGSFWLFKTLLDYARRVNDITDLIIAVHPKHEKLYRHFAFKPMGDPMPYDQAKGNPGLPMHLDVLKLEHNLASGIFFRKFFFEQESPLEMLTQFYQWPPETLRDFLSRKRHSWNEMSSRFNQYFENHFSSSDASRRS